MVDTKGVETQRASNTVADSPSSPDSPGLPGSQQQPERRGDDLVLTIRHYTTHLAQPHWLIPLIGLVETFEGLPVEDEQESMAAELLVILGDLYLLSHDMPMDADGLQMRLARRLSELPIWDYRVCTVDPPRTYWNPLKETYSSFSQDRETVCRIQRDSHPATDVIRTWLQEAFKGC